MSDPHDNTGDQPGTESKPTDHAKPGELQGQEQDPFAGWFALGDRARLAASKKHGKRGPA